MNYVISDIHGCYKEYLEMLNKINFSDEDILFILGDLVDRGPMPVELLLDVMKRPNVVCIAGNHEVMAAECFDILLKEITDENIAKLSTEKYEAVIRWHLNGAEPTMSGMQKLDNSTKKMVFDFITDFELYEEITVNDKEYILVHAGFSNFDKSRELWDYELHELVWQRPDYDIPYFEDKIVITGHTPTRNIDPTCGDSIIKKNNHIAIDCGCCFGGRLACICLETGEEFYVNQIKDK